MGDSLDATIYSLAVASNYGAFRFTIYASLAELQLSLGRCMLYTGTRCFISSTSRTQGFNMPHLFVGTRGGSDIQIGAFVVWPVREIRLAGNSGRGAINLQYHHFVYSPFTILAVYLYSGPTDSTTMKPPSKVNSGATPDEIHNRGPKLSRCRQAPTENKSTGFSHIE